MFPLTPAEAAFVAENATLTFVALSAVAGLVAAVAMNVAMSRQEEGFAPAYVAAAVLRRTTPAATGIVAALVVHHVAGLVTGAVYGACYLLVAGVTPSLVRVGGVGLLPHLVSVTLVVAFIYAFFAHVVLPRAGREIYEERSTAVRGMWLRSSLVFGTSLLVAAPLLTAVR
jgi:hypothetical protein